MKPAKSVNWLRNRWYQAGWADEVTAKTPLVRTILNEPIMFYRMTDGSIAALFDRCPHRFAPLSAGTIDGDIVTCGYHGLGFASNGACVANPHGPVTGAMRVSAYPVAERHSALWIWMGDPVLANTAQIPDLSFIDETPEAARIQMYMPTRANYQLITDNILDLSHADYLHPNSLGGIMVGSQASSREEGDTIVAECRHLRLSRWSRQPRKQIFGLTWFGRLQRLWCCAPPQSQPASRVPSLTNPIRCIIWCPKPTLARTTSPAPPGVFWSMTRTSARS
jgi:phenylpropionate dioxygenase-like ring-hydroxylating dioxygenase large terminal subunit